MSEVKQNFENFNVSKNSEFKKIEKKDYSIELEKKTEKQLEVKNVKNKEKTKYKNSSIVRNAKKNSIALDQEMYQAVDKILESGLENLYLSMPKEKQKEFKIKGEETASKITIILSEAKIKVKKIVQSIIEWLKIIPKLNKFFIKQTAKIKTDKILELKKSKKSEK